MENALITGGARGLGRMFALKLLKRGANVVVADFDEKAGRAFEKETLDQYRGKRLFLKCDVSNTEELRKTLDDVTSYFGRLDVLCNNAAIMTWDHSLREKQIATNLTAVVEGTYKGIDLMSVKNGGKGGVIVNISSGLGYNLHKGAPVYTATKFGVVGFSRTFKFLETKDVDRVRVNCICPFFVDSEHLKRGVEGVHRFDDVTAALMMCIDNPELNGEVISALACTSLVTLHD